MYNWVKPPWGAVGGSAEPPPLTVNSGRVAVQARNAPTHLLVQIRELQVVLEICLKQAPDSNQAKYSVHSIKRVLRPRGKQI